MRPEAEALRQATLDHARAQAAYDQAVWQAAQLGLENFSILCSHVLVPPAMEAILSAVAKDGVLLTGLTTEEVVRTATISQVGAVVFVRGQEPTARIIDQAKSFNLPLLVTDYSMFVSIGKLYMNGLRGLDGSW